MGLQHLVKVFTISFLVLIVGLTVAYLWDGWSGLYIATILTILEISLSFDNAVINASVLKTMDPVWRKRFLTWGILIAVFGMRLVFPIAVVAIISDMNSLEVMQLAVTQPEEYKNYLEQAHVSLAAFGGMFLLMVFLSFILDPDRDIHWLGVIERKLGIIGKLESIEIVFALCILLATTSLLPPEAKAGALKAGIYGLVVYVILHGLMSLVDYYKQHAQYSKIAKHAGLMSFVYLEVLDATFSFDGVIGAFAITKDVVIIMIGLGIGAFFVRSMTIFFVERATLSKFIYLEHGAHYALGALSIMMLYSMYQHVPEIIVGSIGLVLIILSYLSSMRHHRLRQS